MADYDVIIDGKFKRIVVKRAIDKEQIKQYFTNSNIIDLIDDKISRGVYQYIKINSLELFVMKFSNKIIILEMTDTIRYLLVDELNHEYEYFDGSLYNDYHEIINLIEHVKKMFSNYDSLINLSYILESIRLFDASINDKVIEDENIFLALKKFRIKDNFNNLFTIVKKDTFEVVGNIEFCLYNKESDVPFSGNVSYEIYEKYRNKGYGTKALKLLKAFIKELETQYNKDLYIAILEDNEYSRKVALNNGGYFYKNVDVPASDKLYFLGKVNHVLIYKISDF